MLAEIFPFNSSQQVNQWFEEGYGPGNTSIQNGTMYINTTSFKTSDVKSSNYQFQTEVHIYPINICNKTIAVSVSPEYNLEQYQLVFTCGRYAILINSYGIPGKLNYTYVNNIGRHIYANLVNS